MRVWKSLLLGTWLCAGCGALSDAPGGKCQTEGECTQTRQAFTCNVEVPTQGSLPPIDVSADAPASQTGGAIRDGKYTIKHVSFFGDVGSIPGETIEFRSGSYHRNHTTYSAISGEPMTGFEETGTYDTKGLELSLEGAACLGNGTPARTVIWQYSVQGSQLQILKRSGEQSWLETYERSP